MVSTAIVAAGAPVLAASELPGESPTLKPRIRQSDLREMSLNEMVEHGRRIFSTPLNVLDGLAAADRKRVLEFLRSLTTPRTEAQ